MGVDVATFIVMIDDPDPGAATEDGLKLAFDPDGRPDASSLMADLNPLETVVLIVSVAEDPCAAVTEGGEAEIAKGGAIWGGAEICTTEPAFTIKPYNGFPSKYSIA